MRVLVVCRYKEGLPDHAAPFVMEQMRALQVTGVACRQFLVKGGGVRGYLKQLGPLKEAIGAFHPDVIHAHYGLCGVLATLQHEVPVVTTFHGSDVNDRATLPFSRMAMRRSAWSVFVSRRIMEKARPKNRFSVLPCGVDFNALQLTEKEEARQRLGLDRERRYVLFAGAFDVAVKNASLAREAVALLNDPSVELLELKGYSREEVTLLMCAADVLLMTSLNEGSPQVIKEAMVCGCPIVSVNVGDVGERIGDVEGCYLAQTREPQEIVSLLEKALAFMGKTEGREKAIADGLENCQVANELMKIYHNLF